MGSMEDLSNLKDICLGKSYRLRNIFSRNDKALIVAMDHGIIGIVEGLEDFRLIAEKVIEAGADALLVTPGAAKYLIRRLKRRIPLIVSIPYDVKYVELALKLDADAVKTMYFGTVPLDWETIQKIAAVSSAADEWGIPYMVEIVPCDKNGEIIYDIEKIKQAVRMGSELGGDIIKTAYVGPPSKYSEVVRASFAPITVMGGPKMETTKEVLSMLKEAVEAGASGGAIGRNIWRHESPDKVVKALISILHEGKDVEEAMKILEK